MMADPDRGSRIEQHARVEKRRSAHETNLTSPRREGQKELELYDFHKMRNEACLESVALKE